MAILGFIALVFLTSLAGPTSAARQGLSDEDLNLEGQIGDQGYHQSSAADQEGLQMQNDSLTSPTSQQIRQASATAGFANRVYDAFALGGSMTSIPSIGGTIISAGLKLWVGQMRIHMLKLGLCADFMHSHDFGAQMRTVWDDVIVPALTASAANCHTCSSQGGGAAEEKCGSPGDMKNLDCEKMSNIAQNWLLYMEVFLNVLTYLTAHADLCTTHISQVQRSWNDLAEGVKLAYGGHHWVYEFWWSDFMNHPKSAHRPASMEGVDKQMTLHTTWNPFRTDSSLDRIIGVAIRLGIYDNNGEVKAEELGPEAEEEEPVMQPVVRSTAHIQDVPNEGGQEQEPEMQRVVRSSAHLKG